MSAAHRKSVRAISLDIVWNLIDSALLFAEIGRRVEERRKRRRFRRHARNTYYTVERFARSDEVQPEHRRAIRRRLVSLRTAIEAIQD